MSTDQATPETKEKKPRKKTAKRKTAPRKKSVAPKKEPAKKERSEYEMEPENLRVKDLLLKLVNGTSAVTRKIMRERLLVACTDLCKYPDEIAETIICLDGLQLSRKEILAECEKIISLIN